jgi:hypothetical protein
MCGLTIRAMKKRLKKHGLKPVFKKRYSADVIPLVVRPKDESQVRIKWPYHKHADRRWNEIETMLRNDCHKERIYAFDIQTKFSRAFNLKEFRMYVDYMHEKPAFDGWEIDWEPDPESAEYTILVCTRL